MRFQDQSTKCPGCMNNLIWKSHVRVWKQARQVHEFTFQCMFKDDQIIEKRTNWDPTAESFAILRC